MEKTEENLRQVSALRKEIAPHLKFLGKQMEKLAERDMLRAELVELYRRYLSCEQTYIETEEARIREGERGPRTLLAQVDERIATLSRTLSHEGEVSKEEEALLRARRALAEVQSTKEELMRRAGRVEGMIEVQEERSRERAEASAPVPHHEVEKLAHSLEECVVRGEREQDPYAIRLALIKVRELVRSFLSRISGVQEKARENLEKVRAEKEEIDRALAEIRKREGQEAERVRSLERQIEEAGKTSREQERELFDLKSQRAAAEQVLERVRLERERLEFITREFKEELQESRVLAGREAPEELQEAREQANKLKQTLPRVDRRPEQAQEELRRQVG
ncbi:MAG: hypothetical protein AAB922_05295, partial [Patescibacteria group bacterium]